MIVKCPTCKNNFKIELDNNVVEISVKCPHCGKDITIKNVVVSETTDMEKSDYENSNSVLNDEIEDSNNNKRIVSILATVIILGILLLWASNHFHFWGQKEGFYISSSAKIDDNWDNTNIDFVYVSVPDDEMNGEYYDIRDKVMKRGVPFGTYCYCDNSDHSFYAVPFFENFKKIVPKESLDLIPAIFVNSPSILNLDKEGYINNVNKLIELFKDYYGAYPLVCCLDHELRHQLQIEECPIWTPFIDKLTSYSDWKSGKIVPHNSGFVQGIDKDVYFIYLNGSINDIRLK